MNTSHYDSCLITIPQYFFSHSRMGMSCIVVAGNYLCVTCTYPTLFNLKAWGAYYTQKLNINFLFSKVHPHIQFGWLVGRSVLRLINPFWVIKHQIKFQTIQFIKSTQFSSIWPINRTLSSVTTPGQSAPGSNGNEGVLHIPQSSSITRTSPSDCLVSYPGYLLRESYPLQRCSQSILQPQPTGQLIFKMAWLNISYISMIQTT